MLIPLREQLKNDKIYRKWMAKQPPLTNFGYAPAWVVFVQLDNERWARKFFRRYSDGYRFIADRINDFQDLSLSCRRQSFKPPIIRSQGKLAYRLPQLERPPDAPHLWCPYCRRLSIFKPFSRHHALRAEGRNIRIRYIDRCTICGVPLQFIPRYQ